MISDLSRSTDYEFRIRAKRLNYGTHSDNAIGPWAENVASVRTTAVPVNPIVRKAQVAPTVPQSIKRKKTMKFSMSTSAGIAMSVSSKGACKTSKIVTKKKVGKKRISTQTGWKVTATKKGSCVIAIKANGNAIWEPLDVTRIVKIS